MTTKEARYQHGPKMAKRKKTIVGLEKLIRNKANIGQENRPKGNPKTTKQRPTTRTITITQTKDQHTHKNKNGHKNNRTDWFRSQTRFFGLVI